MMNLIALVAAYLMIIAICVVAIGMVLFLVANKVMDMLGVRKEFLMMKRERDFSRSELQRIKNEVPRRYR